MNQEKFKLWRLALSFIHVDGEVSSEEEQWFEKKIKELDANKVLDFSDRHILELKKVLHTPCENFVNEFRQLKSPADCAQLLHFLRTIGHVDGKFCQREKALFEKIEAALMEGVDVESVRQKTKAMEKRSYHEDEVYKVHNPHSSFEKAFMGLMRILNPGDYRMP